STSLSAWLVAQYMGAGIDAQQSVRNEDDSDNRAHCLRILVKSGPRFGREFDRSDHTAAIR
ncbi:MAG TPA: hypothetical protein VNF29_06250, partial [Candidatus Binataceae bacterium]|nr:hypothetical protein [Candidatus Binataceae bacterium]